MYDRLTIVIEYDVAVVDRSQFAHSPLLVEMEKTTNALLGIHLANDAKGSNRITIESIACGSIAERYIVFNGSFELSKMCTFLFEGAALCRPVITF